MKTISEISHEKNLNSFNELVNYLNPYVIEFKSKNLLINNQRLSEVIENAKEANREVELIIDEYIQTLSMREYYFLEVKTEAEKLALLSKENAYPTLYTLSQKLTRPIVLSETEFKQLIDEINDCKRIIREAELLERKYNKFIRTLKTINYQIKITPDFPEQIQAILLKFKRIQEELEIIQEKLKLFKHKINKARIGRNNIVYKTDSGLVDVAHDTKVHIKRRFGNQSKEWEKVSEIKFTRIK